LEQALPRRCQLLSLSDPEAEAALAEVHGVIHQVEVHMTEAQRT